jgi:tRNA-(ms[2]io[6]A)-hydroxylase
LRREIAGFRALVAVHKGMSEPRRLPILGQKPAPPPGSPTFPTPDQDDDRPPWHWSAIGSVLVFVLWLPLSMITAWISRLAVGESPDAATATHGRAALVQIFVAILGLGLASLAGGAIITRYGKTAGVREATVSGLAVAIVSTLVAAVTSGRIMDVWIVVPVSIVSGGCCHLGGRLGEALRRRRA